MLTTNKRSVIKNFLVAALFISAITAAHGQSAPDTLYVGMTAPPIRVAEWLKGKSVPSFQPGKVYVVEFTSVYCPPCRASIPHLTALAKQYKEDVTVIGVFVYDEEPRVKKFVQNMGDGMSYHVAIDETAQTMVDTWMKPAGILGVPYTFIVDKQGKIAWIGSPFQMDTIVAQVVNDRLDIAFAASQRSEVIYTELLALQRKGDYKTALHKVDSMLLRESQGFWAVEKFTLLQEIYLPSAHQFGWDLLAKGYDVEPELVKMASYAAFFSQQPDTALALALCDRALDVCKAKNILWAINNLKAHIHAHKKNYVKAAEMIRKALDNLQQYAPEDLKNFREELDNSLAEYSKRANG